MINPKQPLNDYGDNSYKNSGLAIIKKKASQKEVTSLLDDFNKNLRIWINNIKASLGLSLKNTRSYNQYELKEALANTPIKKTSRFLSYFTIVFMLVSLVYGVIRFGITETLVVEGSSMKPYLNQDDKITIEKLWSKVDGFKRGDVVVVMYEGKLLVKRVIGLPGEIVELKNQKVFIYNSSYWQGVELKEDYISTPTCKIPDCSLETEKFTIKEKQLYLLGDNRQNSNDSRSFGSLSYNSVLGKVLLANTKTINGFIKGPEYNISAY
jgi:signal peptidase I